MPLVTNFLSRNQSLYALDDNDDVRAYTEITTQMSGWSCTASIFEISQDYREYPLYYSFKIQDSNADSTITLSINNIQIDGVNTTNLNSFKLVGHALFRADAAARVNATLGVRSSFDLNNVAKLYSASSQTSLTAAIQTPVRSGHIDVRKKSTAVLTSVYGNGTYIKYDCANSFKRGDLVYIYDTTQESFNATTTPVSVQYSCNSFFTVQSPTTGYVLPTSGYVKLSDPPQHLISYPYQDYAGEDIVASLSFVISQHAGEPIYVTIPTIVDMNRIFASWSTQLGTQTLPQVLIDIDQSSTTEWPILRLMHSLTGNVEDVVDKYVAIERTDANLRPAYIDTNDNINKSYLVDPDVALSDYYDWLIQFVGQTQSFASMYSNKAADYGATVKVRCATTANITIATALNSGDSIDGVTLAAGDRVLVKNQTTASQNGIYIVSDSPARWDGMPASSASISSILPVTPSLGYTQVTTSGAHGFSAGDTVVIAGVTPSGHNGEYVIFSVPTTTTFVIESTEVATATLSSATAKRAVNTTNPDLIFIREGTIGKMTMWSPFGATWPVIGTDSITFSVKQVAAKVATTANITIASELNSGDSIDGVILADGDYVLVKNQTTASQNGLYKVATTPTRAENMASTLSLSTGFRAYVWGSGTTSIETMFTLNEDGVVGTDTLAFTPTAKPFAWDDANEFKLWQLSNKYFGYKAGSLEAIEETVRRYLIGNKEIRISLNPPFECIIYTLRDETPGVYYTSDFINTSEIITNVISIIRPLGFKITHSAVAAFDTFIIGTGIIGTDRLG